MRISVRVKRGTAASLLNYVSDSLPSSSSWSDEPSQNSREWAETVERALVYVAATRVRKALVALAPRASTFVRTEVRTNSVPEGGS